MQLKQKKGKPMSESKIRNVIRLWELGRNQSEIASEVGVSRAAVQDYTRRAKAVPSHIKETELAR